LETGRFFGWELEYVLMFLPATAISLGSMSIPTIGLHVVEITSYTKCDMPSVASNIQEIFFFSSNHSRQKERKRNSSQLGLR
jgi:hypothetical protein